MNNSQANFIPMRMRGQGWQIGNLSILKILFALVGVIIPSIIFLPLLSLKTDTAKYSAIILTVGFIIFNQVLVWIPHSSGHSLLIALWLKFNYKISYNNFNNKTKASIFDIYKYKTETKKVNETLILKWNELKKNLDGSYSLKHIKNKTNITNNHKDDFNSLKELGILKIKDGSDESKSRYFLGFKVIGYDISHKSHDEIKNIISQLHNVFKNITTPHTLIKLSQPVNFADNVRALDKEVSEIIKRNNNEEQRNVQYDILALDKKRFINNDKDNFSLENVPIEVNWFLILNGENLAEIKAMRESIIKEFNKLKIDLKLLNQNQLSNVFISLYAPYISFNDRNILNNDANHWNEILNFNNIEILDNVVKAKPYLLENNIKTHDTFLKVGLIKDYPTITPPFAWLYKLATSFDAIVMHNNLVDKEEIHKLINQSFENTELKRANTTNKSKKGEMEFLYNSFKQLSNSIGSGLEKIYDSTIYTINYSFTKPSDAISSFNQSKTMAKNLGFTVIPLTYQQRAGFGDLFVKSKLLLPKYKFPLPAYCYAYGFPFISATINDLRGTIIGKTDKGEQFVFDMTKIDSVRKNHNMFILGNSGTGKSTFLKLLWMHLYGRGHKIFITDPEAEDDNEKLVRNLKGTYIDMAETKINPLIINIYNEDKKHNKWTYDIDNKASWLSEWFATIFGYDPNNSFQTMTKAIFAKWITKYYNSYGIKEDTEVSDNMIWPSVGEFYQYLKSQVETIKSKDGDINIDCEEELLKQLQLYFIDGNMLPSKLWNTNSTFVDLSKSYLNSFNISKLVNQSSNIQRASYMLLLDLANKEMWRNKIYNDANKRVALENHSNYDTTFLFLIFDEAHLMIDRKNPTTTAFLAETGARCRKYSTSLIVATQNVKTFTGDPEILYQSTRIINNTQYSLSLGLKENDIEELDKLWEPIGGLTEQEKDFLSNAQKGDCIFAVTSQNRIQVLIDIGKDEAFRKYASFIKDDKAVNKKLDEE